MLIQVNSNITSSSNINSEAVNIQRVNSGINGFISLTTKVIRTQIIKSSILNTGSLLTNSIKISYSKTGLSGRNITTLSKVKTYSTAKANIKSSSTLKCYYSDKDIQVALKSYIPPFLRKSKIFDEVLRVQANGITKENALLKDLSMQFYLDTATWGLDYWENDLGIVTNPNLSYEQRREKIKFKLQITNTTITKKFFKSVMDKYYICNLDEDFNNSKVNITVTGKRGIPPRLNEMISDAEELLPAHLTHEFIFTYLPWDELDNSNLTWNDIETYTWDELLSSFL